MSNWVSLPIMLVGYSPDEREIYSRYIEVSGHTTLHARTARAALRLAIQRQPAVVIAEIALPGREDGLTLTRWLKADGRTKSIPVVLLTGHAFKADRQAAVRAGCDLFLAKPCLPGVLVAAVSRMIDARATA